QAALGRLPGRAAPRRILPRLRGDAVARALRAGRRIARGDEQAPRGDQPPARRPGRRRAHPPRRRPRALRQHAGGIRGAAARRIRALRRDRKSGRRQDRLTEKKRALHVSARITFAFALLVLAMARAQGWPDRPVRVVATSPPGGPVALLARLAAE